MKNRGLLWAAAIIMLFFVGFKKFFDSMNASDLARSRNKTGRIERLLDEPLALKQGGFELPQSKKDKSKWERVPVIAQNTPNSIDKLQPTNVPQPKPEPEKKKKKKKKKVTKKNPVVQTRVVQKAPTDNLRNSQESPLLGSMMGLATPIGKNKNNGSDMSYEDWRNLLLNSRSYDAIEKLIKYYQINLIDKASYYALLDEMIGTGNEVLQGYAVLALGVSPSVESFFRLVSLKEINRSSKVNSEIEGYLKSYQTPSQLGILATALKSSDLPAVVEAHMLLRESIRANLTVSSTVADSGRVHRRNRTVVKDENETSYYPFVSILADIQRTDADLSLRQMAGETLSILLQFLPDNGAVATR